MAQGQFFLYRINLKTGWYNDFMKILLAQIMYNRQLSIRQVSILTGLPKSTIQKVMNEQSNPTIRTLEQLAFGLKIKISDLYESECCGQAFL